MPLNFEILRPYQSLILARVRTGERTTGLVDEILHDIDGALNLDATTRSAVETGVAHREGVLEIGGFRYVVVKPPPWTSDAAIEDRSNQLVIVFRRNREVAILLTETAFRQAVTAGLDQPKFPGLGRIEPLAPEILNAAFVNGPAKTIWLSGIHGRTTLKPDAKTLSGLNLRDALDPLSDQTYFMTAVRSKVEAADIDSSVGVSPRSSRIWLSSSADWHACREGVAAVLGHLSSIVRGNDDPLPFVALASKALDRLGSAYEMAVIPPQLLAEDPTIDPADLQELEHWSENTTFHIEESTGNEIRSVVQFGGEELGTVTFRLVGRKRGRFGVEAEFERGNDRLEALLNHCRREHWLRVWFDSGHTFNGDSIFQVRFRDYPFENFLWHDFAGYEVTREKPGDPIDPDAIGLSNSLFCWTLHSWPLDGGAGWLVCDDGAMELADFIHLDRDMLTMIHAKGSNSNDQTRQISVSSYEVVASQAIKCLRWLDQTQLHDGLVRGMRRKIGRAVWHNRRPSDRARICPICLRCRN